MRGLAAVIGGCVLLLAGCRTSQPGAGIVASHAEPSGSSDSSPVDGLLTEQRSAMAAADQERAEGTMRARREPAGDRRDRPLRPPVRPPH